MGKPLHDLAYLLARGDVVAVNHGRLTITPNSGKPVPAGWLANNTRSLIAEAAGKAGVLALEYLSYSTGNYGPKRLTGITLQFCCLATGESHYAIFNANTKRSRNTKSGKAGDPLPKGQFRVGKNSAFVAFWKSTGLPFHRLSDFHDYMGNLGNLIFTAEKHDGERLEATTLRPLNVPWERLAIQIHPDNFPTPSRQAPDKIPTRLPDKETPESQQPSGIQPIPTTGQERCGKTVTRDYGYTGRPVSPDLQSTDEWLDDYELAQPL